MASLLLLFSALLHPKNPALLSLATYSLSSSSSSFTSNSTAAVKSELNYSDHRDIEDPEFCVDVSLIFN
ncbi:hypothetical protein M5689_010769 [Euphorbia peplus]|nr:hypothetical protein M5689_010769 [Euphorbia peplus]